MCLDFQTGKGTVECCLARLHSCTGSDCQLLGNFTVNKAVSEQFEFGAQRDSSSVLERHLSSCQPWKAHRFFSMFKTFSVLCIIFRGMRFTASWIHVALMDHLSYVLAFCSL